MLDLIRNKPSAKQGGTQPAKKAAKKTAASKKKSPSPSKPLVSSGAAVKPTPAIPTSTSHVTTLSSGSTPTQKSHMTTTTPVAVGTSKMSPAIPTQGEIQLTNGCEFISFCVFTEISVCVCVVLQVVIVCCGWTSTNQSPSRTSLDSMGRRAMLRSYSNGCRAGRKTERAMKGEWPRDRGEAKLRMTELLSKLLYCLVHQVLGRPPLQH